MNEDDYLQILLMTNDDEAEGEETEDNSIVHNPDIGEWFFNKITLKCS